MYGVAEDNDIIKICRDRNLTLPEDLREEEYEDEEEEEIEEEPLEEVDIYIDVVGFLIPEFGEPGSVKFFL